ncbi:MAG: hypothetical protein KTR16_16715 [Acidiferrobacterales bacterium]|nr:hypothetical protein [Acidiferrobacterales bacterium]
MKKLILIKVLLVIFFSSLPLKSSLAAFPDDLSDVVILERFPSGIQGFAETVYMEFSVSASPVNSFGRAVYLNGNRPWRASTGSASCCNAEAWMFAQIGGVWYGATWEYLRVGQVTKSEAAISPSHLQIPPMAIYPRSGEIYGFMVSGITRPGLQYNNARERSNVSLYRWDVGPVDASEIGGGSPVTSSAPPMVGPAIDILMEED